jgi:DNA-binding NarL/FixJ family response regulator
VNAKGRVLLADDDAAVRRATCQVLGSGGFEVDAVATAHEAIQALSRKSYDACVADINMPGNERLELIEALRGAAGVPLVLITGEPSVATAVTAFRGGVLDYIPKPLLPDELLARVSAVVQKGRELRAAAQAQANIAVFIEAATQVIDSARAEAGLPSTPRAGHSPQVAAPAAGPRLPADLMSSLSPRQQDVVRLLAAGHPIPEVAELLRLSVHTVRGHMKVIFSKLGVQGQVALLSKLAGNDVPKRR